MTFDSSIWTIAIGINFILIAFAQNIPLLTKTGWFHAGALGTILWGCLGWEGWLAVVLYLFLGSLVTRIGFEYKKNVGIAEKRGGKRGPENIWGSAATGTFLAILFKLGIGQEYIILSGFAASFSSKLADTFGSEIGQRWGKRAFLITSLRSVPPGTDGAISLAGTVASLIGSLIMTLCMLILNIIVSIKTFIVVSIVGFIATLLESFIGAYIQKKFLFMTNEVVNFIQTFIASIITILIVYLY